MMIMAITQWPSGECAPGPWVIQLQALGGGCAPGPWVGQLQGGGCSFVGHGPWMLWTPEVAAWCGYSNQSNAASQKFGASCPQSRPGARGSSQNMLLQPRQQAMFKTRAWSFANWTMKTHCKASFTAQYFNDISFERSPGGLVSNLAGWPGLDTLEPKSFGQGSRYQAQVVCTSSHCTLWGEHLEGALKCLGRILRFSLEAVAEWQ